MPLILVMQSVEDERIQRQRLRDLAVFERLDGDPRKSSPALAVKKVCKVCYFFLNSCVLVAQFRVN